MAVATLPSCRIGWLAAAGGVTVDTVRYYERQGTTNSRWVPYLQQ
jgi:DNA-binding transcriptional MerR regulator